MTSEIAVKSLTSSKESFGYGLTLIKWLAGAHEDGVSVWRCVARGARQIVDDGLLAQAFAQMRRQQPGYRVNAAAGSEPDQHSDGFCGG